MIRSSILTVVRNDIAGLKSTYDSISPLPENVEWIVVDGASTDGASDWLSTLDPAPKWISEPDMGIYDAMNKAALLACGEWAVYLNAGDCMPVNLYVKIDQILPLCAAEFLYGASRLVLPNGRVLLRNALAWPSCIANRLPAIHQAIWYRRSVLLDFPFREDLRICGDYDQLARMAIAGRRGERTDAVLATFRVGDTSFRHPWILICESMGVRRGVLRQGPFQLSWAFLRLLLSTCVLQIATRLVFRRASP